MAPVEHVSQRAEACKAEGKGRAFDQHPQWLFSPINYHRHQLQEPNQLYKDILKPPKS